jgi:hypothetical protein
MMKMKELEELRAIEERRAAIEELKESMNERKVATEENLRDMENKQKKSCLWTQVPWMRSKMHMWSFFTAKCCFQSNKQWGDSPKCSWEVAWTLAWEVATWVVATWEVATWVPWKVLCDVS